MLYQGVIPDLEDILALKLLKNKFSSFFFRFLLFIYLQYVINYQMHDLLILTDSW